MTALTASRTTVPFARVAGVTTIAAAVVGFLGALWLLGVAMLGTPAVSPDTFSYPLDVAGNAVAQVLFFLNHVGLAVGLVALARGPAATRAPGRVGAWIALASMVVLAICELWAISYADATLSSGATGALDSWYGLGSIVVGAGLVVAGIGVARTRYWAGWRRWIVLVTGASLFVVVVPGLAFGFIGGRVVLAAWMIAWAGVGLALLTGVGRRDSA
ncbi:hypothetical protein ET445_01205 [Agromyces protaetiae]|uniref:DUF998 domain-containing protein n=1 Tax=Agromyces protaetiae TaxID=2509455 RepID=A0A4P6FEM7_9MICO|nr:hypothetical protein [Agromyces protaetiae]QAY72157.1 hypothetical protein ET445_01205 [Agromyces protaetiae]